MEAGGLEMIQELILEGFRQFQKRTSINFSSGLNLIQGKNDAGKTTILLGIEYALLGDVQGYRSFRSLKTFGKKSQKIRAELMLIGIDGKRYHLIREHIIKKRVAGAFSLSEIKESGERVTLLISDQNTVEELQKKLGEITNFSRRLFQAVANGRQASHRNLLEGPKELDVLLGITASENLSQIFRTRSKELRSQEKNKKEVEGDLKRLKISISNIEDAISEKKTQLGELKKEQEEIKTQITSLTQITSKVRVIESEINTSVETIAKIARIEDLKAKEKKDLEEMVANGLDEVQIKKTIIKFAEQSEKHKSTKKENQNKEMEIRKTVDSLIGRRGDLEGQIKRREQVKGETICEYCGSELDPNKIHSDLIEKKDEFDNINEQISIHNNEIETLEKEVDQILKVEREIEVEKSSLENKLATIERRKEYLNKYSQEQEVLENQLKEQQEKLESKRKELKIFTEASFPEISTSLGNYTVTELESLQKMNKEVIEKISKEEGSVQSRKNSLDREIQSITSDVVRFEGEIALLGEQQNRLITRLVAIERMLDIAVRFKRIEEALSTYLEHIRTSIKRNLEEHILSWYKTIAADQEFVEVEVDAKNYSLRVVPTVAPSYEPVKASQISGGGHQMLLSIAYRIALAQLLGNVSLLIIDEPTDGTDTENCRMLLDQIVNVSRVFPQIFMITHHGLAEENADNIIRVERRGMQSYIIEAQVEDIHRYIDQIKQVLQEYGE